MERRGVAVLLERIVLVIEFSTRQPEWGAVALGDGVAITADGHESLTTVGREFHVTAV